MGRCFIGFVDRGISITLMTSKKITIKIGFPKEKQVVYPPKIRDIRQKDGSFKKSFSGGGETVAEVATWNNFGTKNIPERPFFTKAINDNKEFIKNLVAEAVKKRKVDPTSFDKVGLAIVNLIKDSIVNGKWQENAHKTKVGALPPSLRKAWDYGKPGAVAHKKAEEAIKNKKPLIDRGIMLKSVSYVVTEE